MQRLYSMFPRGAPGVGLLFLRISIIGSLHTLIQGEVHGAVVALIAGLGIGYLAGFMTPAVSVLSIVVMLALAISGNWTPESISMTLLLQSSALIFLGPGAYSLDARMYGRKIIKVGRRL